MCGICGFTWRDEPALAAMVGALRHRGPDASGTYVSDVVSIGHTRLSILDLTEAGSQPMQDEQARVVVSYNGEVYNFAALRSELERLGHVFRGHSDTEVLLRAYLQWKEGVFPRLNGMWAACILDVAARRLILCRDRMGVKPLYYMQTARGLSFASEIGPLLLLNGPQRVSPEAVDFLLASQFVPSPRTVYEGIAKLEPRQLMEVDLDARTTRLRFYYDIPAYTPGRSRSALVEEGRALFEDALRLRLVSDVPVGAFLSGGLDSTTVVAGMSALVDPGQLHTVSAGFDLPGLDETPYIEEAHRAFGTVHHHLVFATQDVPNALNEVSKAYDEPVLDPSSLPMYRLCGEARKWMTVALSGDGADEVFGGYASRTPALLVQRMQRVPRWMRNAGRGLLRAVAGYGLSGLGGVAEGLRVSLAGPEAYFGELGASTVYRPPVFQAWAREKLAELLPLADGDLLEAVLKFDLHYNRLGDNYCAKVDKMSMAHALEVRSPFLDYRFAEFAAHVPTRWKLRRGKTKILMRDIVGERVPASILHREKHGFAAPLGAWAASVMPRLSEGVESMHEDGVLSGQWRAFLLGTAFVRDEPTLREYPKRFAQLLAWYERHRA